MSRCKFCGEPAGFLRSAHPACRALAEEGLGEIAAVCRACMHGEKDPDAARDEAAGIVASHKLTPELARPTLVSAWETALAESLEHDVTTAEQEARLVTFAEVFGLGQDALDVHGAWTRLTKAAILRDVLAGEIPQRVDVPGPLPFNLQKAEKLVWLFRRVRYLTERTHREFVGGTSGFSVRVAKGVYFRTGGFHGRRVETTSMDELAVGEFGITNKHVYFAGGSKAFRIAFGKIVSLHPYADGLGLVRDAARAKPEVFKLDDGWFAYNLVTNLGQLS